MWDQSRTLVVLNYAALSLAIVITLWGAGVAGTLEALERQHELLRAADALETRARAIHECTIDDTEGWLE